MYSLAALTYWTPAQRGSILRNPLSCLARMFLPALLAATCWADPPQVSSSQQQPPPSEAPHSAEPARGASPPTMKYHMVFDAAGVLKWRSAAKTGETPLEVHSEQTYFERKAPAAPADPSVGPWAIRYYQSAQANYTVGGTNRQQRLSPNHRLVILDFPKGKLRAYSPYEPLHREELDLLDLPCSTLVLADLLPDRDRKVGSKWAVPDDVVRRLFGLSAVVRHNLEGTWLRKEQQTAVLEYAGNVEGKIDGTDTKMEFRAKINAVLPQAQVTWCAMSMREQRAMSESAPGFDIQAKMRLVGSPVSPSEEPAELGEAPPTILQPDSVPLTRTSGPEGKWSILHDTQWKLIVARHDITILRLFDSGELIGQAIITTLPDGPAGRHISAQTFQEEILQMLREYAGHIMETSQGENDRGVRVLRATAAGVVGDTSMQWIFYHLSDDHGRRVGMAFTVESDKVEQFGERDRVIVETFSFAPPSSSTDGPAEGSPAATFSRLPSAGTGAGGQIDPSAPPPARP